MNSQVKPLILAAHDETAAPLRELTVAETEAVAGGGPPKTTIITLSDGTTHTTSDYDTGMEEH